MESVHHTPSDSLYRKVTAEIIQAIEDGITGEYQMPWHRSTAQGLPMNVSSGKHYHGINTLTLWVTSLKAGYPTPFWASYKQWNDIGAQVRRGEHGTPVLFFKPLEQDQKDTPVSESSELPERRRIVVRLSHVFNAEQVHGWPAPGIEPIDRTDQIALADRFIEGIGATIRYGGSHAYYSRSTDHIQMPERSSFTGTETSTPTEAFYATLFHEHVHWSGHRDRLNRDLSGRFGESAYAMEELVAELGAAFLCAELKIANVPRKDHVLYVRSWLPVLKEKATALPLAAASAMKACQYLGERVEQVREAA